MRTTIDLELDALLAVKEIAQAEGVSLGKVVSRLVRQALTGPAPAVVTRDDTQGGAATGFVPFAPRGVVVSNELIDKLRDGEGI